jgi:23S rRNA G2445 N2-methylase RlmL
MRLGAGRDRPPATAMNRLFALCVPGVGPVLSAEIADHSRFTVIGSGFDGRADVVLFETGPGAQREALQLRTAEDVFVEVGRALRADGDDPRWIAERVWRPRRVERALSVWAREVGPLGASMTFRVVARVLQERSFQRSELRRQLSRAVGADRPRWKVADPGRIEIWISEYAHGRFVAGLRLSDVTMRQRGGRLVERHGALRPSVAAAMIRLAGSPSGLLLDPCCGSGTILAEAHAAGWRVEGSDIDTDAVRIARRNLPAALVRKADVRSIDRDDGTVSACVSNLPFGQQFGVAGPMSRWRREAIREMVRVTRPGGRLVLLAPTLPGATTVSGLRLLERHRIRLLGTATTLWVFERR